MTLTHSFKRMCLLLSSGAARQAQADCRDNATRGQEQTHAVAEEVREVKRSLRS